ncbi:hypothetical protein [Winogradskyella wichelsiae]|uniref:hypothetical protein n=1 Tax=Winogradskyella wichelsiae TaxID=2697007 RepID=UPI0015CEB1E3|nr:hypothetical protein [Winogradskyella wichelsiae]
MKTNYKFLAMVLLAVSFSCKNESSKKEINTRNPMNKELTDTQNYEEDGNFEEDTYTYESKTDSINENWNLNDPERQMQLYSRFEMSDAQQERYETELQKWWDSEMDDPYKKLSADHRIETESKILKNILDEEQYENYEAWSNDNDKR